MIQYFIGVKGRSYWGVDGASKEEAEVNGRKLLAELLLNGMIAVQVKEREYNPPTCEVCGYVADLDKMVQVVTDGRLLCSQCCEQDR